MYWSQTIFLKISTLGIIVREEQHTTGILVVGVHQIGKGPAMFNLDLMKITVTWAWTVVTAFVVVIAMQLRLNVY